MNEQTATILVVEDDEMSSDHLLFLLSDYRVLVARDGAAALELLNKETPDVILLDIMMPGMDGYEVCRLIKSNDTWKEIPILFITVRTDEESIIKGFDVGGSDFVTKPFFPKELQARIRIQIEYKRALEQLRKVAVTDDLTGILNRRAFFQQGQEHLEQLTSEQRPYAALMMDLDHFKRINDSYGHAVGDIALKQFVAQVTSRLGSTDLAGRLGGEEFAVFLVDTTPGDAVALAESIRKGVEKDDIDIDGKLIPMTVSIGLAFSDAGHTSLDTFLSSADAHLYLAKQNNRNCISYPEGKETSLTPPSHSHIRNRH